MKNYFLLLVGFFLLTRADCYREGKNCHPEILFKNSSGDALCVVPNVFFPDTTLSSFYCPCVGVLPGEIHKENLNDCWEGEFNRIDVLQFFIYGKSIGDNPDCDSVFLNNNILKRYELTLKDLQDLNWTIEYP